MDFGIAKLLGGNDEVDQTRLGHHPMSPQYASPEQVRGDPVTTATDVYALGVVLYELLTGHRPHRFESLTPQAIERTLAVPPALPSHVVRTQAYRPQTSHEGGPPDGGDGPEALPVGISPVRLSRRLRGDLDTIVMTALHTDAERRYGSVEALLSDLRRHRSGLPISAYRDRALYRVQKFVGRHRVGTAFAASVVGAGLAFGAFHNARISAERDAALLEAEKAEQVTAFMIDMFRSSEPNAAVADSLDLDDVLAIGAQRIREELVDQPEVRAAMMSAMGGVYLNLGRYEPARELFEAALSTRGGTLEDDDPAVAESLHELGNVLQLQGDYDRADSMFQAALGILEAQNDAAAEVLAGVWSGLGDVRFAQGRYEDADSLGRMALALRLASLDENHPLIARSHASLGMVARRLDRYEVAERHQREALRLRRDRFGEMHTLVALSIKDVALTLHSQGRLDEAETYYRHALAIQEVLYEGTHPELTTTMNSLASLLAAVGRYDEAIALHRETLRMRLDLYGDAHPRVARSRVNLANALGSRGDLEEATDEYQRALEMYRAHFGARHPSVATALNGLAITKSDAGGRREC